MVGPGVVNSYFSRQRKLSVAEEVLNDFVHGDFLQRSSELSVE